MITGTVVLIVGSGTFQKKNTVENARFRTATNEGGENTITVITYDLYRECAMTIEQWRWADCDRPDRTGREANGDWKLRTTFGLKYTRRRRLRFSAYRSNRNSATSFASPTVQGVTTTISWRKYLVGPTFRGCFFRRNLRTNRQSSGHVARD